MKMAFLKLSSQMEGPQFRSEFRDFLQEWGFQHMQSSPYQHQSNGESEQFVRTVKDVLVKVY